eukprot:3743883-Pyramimonas_sp.AAC.1
MPSPREPLPLLRNKMWYLYMGPLPMTPSLSCSISSPIGRTTGAQRDPASAQKILPGSKSSEELPNSVPPRSQIGQKPK